MIIFSKVWEEGKPFLEIVVKTGKLYLKFSLHYLFLQYGKLKHIVKPRLPRIYTG